MKRGMMIAAVCVLLLVGCSGQDKALTPKTLTIHAEKTMDLFTAEMIPASFERAAW